MEVEVVGLLWLPLEKEISDVIVLAALIEKEPFSLIWEMFDM